MPWCPAARMQPGMAARVGAAWQQQVDGVLGTSAA
jgi:hypothetical protein